MQSCRKRRMDAGEDSGMRLLAGVLFALLGGLRVFAQSAPETVSGTVVDAATGLPVFRALVRLAGQAAPRAVLTDSSGHFSFADVDPAQATLTAMKPGFYAARNATDSGQLHLMPEDAANPVMIRLYPEALITGTILGPDGEPLPRVGVQAFRAVDDDLGRHWVTNATTRSDAHGQFRLPVIAGEYRVETELSREPGSSAVMPTALSEDETGIALDPGEQRELEIHPVLAPLVTVSGRMNLPVDEVGSLIGILPDGTSFPASLTPTGNLTFTAKLPAGSYTLQARHRAFGEEGLDQAAIAVYPAAKQPVTLNLEFVPVASIPVEIALDDAAVAAATAAGQRLTPPGAHTLALALEPSSLLPLTDAEYLRTSFHRGKAGITFNAPPGTYRLRAQRNDGWYITSALYGGMDILGHELTVAAGSGSTPIQIHVSNLMATVAGTVTLRGAPGECWIYLVATSPAAAQVLTLRSAGDGTFRQNVPPGSYRAVAFASRQPPDVEALMRGAPNAPTVNAVVSEKTSVSLEAVPED